MTDEMTLSCPTAIIIGAAIIGASILGTRVVAPYQFVAGNGISSTLRLNTISGTILLCVPQPSPGGGMEYVCK